MSILDDMVEVPRRSMTLFFLVDKSGSMKGKKIDAVNNAIRNVIPMLAEISETNPDAEIKVAAMEFSGGTEWVYDEPKAASDFVWQDVSVEWTGTSLGKVCLELNSKLSRNGYMKTASGAYAPAIMLLSDGEPTDEFEDGLEVLKGNSWFKAAIKIAIAIGEDADQEKLAMFTGSRESVFTVHNIDALKKMIRLVAITSSQIGSKSSTAGETTKQEQVIKEVSETTNEDPDCSTDNYDDWN